MRRYICLLLLIALSAAACGGSRVNVNQERERLMELDRQWSRTTSDIDKFVSYYAPDASVYPPGMPIATGSAAIRDMFAKITATPGFSLRFAPTKADVAASGDLGYVSGTYQMTTNDPSGRPMTDRGKYVEVWKKTGNDWKVTADIFNSDSPPPVAAAAAPATRAKAPASRPARGRAPRRRR